MIYEELTTYTRYNKGKKNNNLVGTEVYRDVELGVLTQYGTVTTIIGNVEVNKYSNGAVEVKQVYPNKTNTNYSGYKASASNLMANAQKLIANNDYVNTQNYFLGRVNAARSAAGKNPVTLDYSANMVAQMRAMEIALSNYYSHARPRGSCDGGDTAMELYPYVYPNIRYTTIGENITNVGTSDADAYLSWEKSAGHYANMIDGRINRIGIGKFTLGNNHYWVMLIIG